MVTAMSSGNTSPAGITSQTAQVDIAAISTSAFITADGSMSPAALPPAEPQVAEDWGSNPSFNAAVYDQFGNVINLDEPNFNWALTDASGKVVDTLDNSSGANMPIPTGTGAGTFHLTAEMSSDTDIAAEIDVVISPFDLEVTQSAGANDQTLNLTAQFCNLGPDADLSSLTYEWTATPAQANVAPPLITTDNFDTANSAEDFTATFFAAGQYVLELTVTTDNGLQIFADPITVMLDQVPAQLLITPTTPVISSSGSNQQARLTATLVDQFDQPMPAVDQPPTIDWQIASGGAGGSLQSAGGNAQLYIPPASLSTTDSFLDTVEASIPDTTFSASVSVHLGIKQSIYLSMAIQSDSDGTVDESEPIQAIINNPSGDPIVSYSVVAVPTDNPNAAPISILQGAGSVGSEPNSPLIIGFIDPTLLPNGIYTITLTATASDGSDSYSNSISQYIQINTMLKLGNLTLPVTDFTVSVPGGSPITVTRTYNSQNISQSMLPGLGYGWSLNGVGPAVQSTANNVLPGERAPSFNWGDLLYVTLPTGQEYIFAFEPVADSSLDNAYQGDLGLLEDSDAMAYVPIFVDVDGTGSTLTVSDASDDEVWYDAGDKLFVNSEGQGYSPQSLQDTYTLTTSDGTSYQISAANGEVTSSTTAAGSSTDYSNNAQTQSGTALVSVGSSDPNYATVTSSLGQKVIYAFKPATESNDPDAGDLIGVTDNAGNVTTYLYADVLLLIAQGSDQEYATISGPSGEVWDLSSNQFVSTGALADEAIPLTSFVSTFETGSHTTWMIGEIPGAIPANTPLTIKYYDEIGSDPATTDPLLSTETRAWAGLQPHYLTGIINPLGVRTLTATYSSQTGELTSLSDTGGNTANLGSSDSAAAQQSVSNAQGDSVQDEYDAYGNVIKQIQAVYGADGKVSQYIVTISDISYSAGEASLDPGSSDSVETDSQANFYNVMEDDDQSAPFVIPASAAADLSLSVDALADKYLMVNGIVQWATMEHFGQVENKVLDQNGNTISSREIWALLNSSTLNSDGTYTETVYNRSEFIDGKPTDIAVYNGNEMISDVTVTAADPSGNPQTSVDALYQKTAYVYSGDPADAGDAYGESSTSPYGPGLPAGLLLQTWQYSGSTWVMTEQNTYFSATDSTHGGLAGYLQSTTDYDYPATGVQQSKTTYYAYDADGNTILTYSPATWTTNAGAPESGWVVNVTQYDLDDRAVATYSATYLGSSLTFSIVPLAGTTGSIQFGNTIYSDVNQSAGAAGAAPQLTSQITYDAAGNVTKSTDQFGATTYYVYNAENQLIDTIYPDGTEARTVYNAQGQVEWQTNQYYTGENGSELGAGGWVLENTIAAMATLTVYDSSGNVIGTEEYQDVLIDILPDTSVGVSGFVQSSIGFYDTRSLLSSTSTAYNAQGQQIESTNAAGLTTGTIYYANGEAEYTGQVITEPAGQMPTGRYLLFDASSNSYLIDYTTSIPDGSGNSWSGPDGTVSFHDENINAAVSFSVAIDALGNATVSFMDALGRVVETDYPDGSFSQTYYSISGQSVNEPSDWGYWYGSTNHAAGYSLSWQPTGLSIPPGGSETVQIAERKTTDPIVPTFYIYDANGNLIDLYEPAVLDGNPADSTYNTYVWPHWHYTYDSEGNETSQIDPNGNVTYFTYDENGNRTSETLPDTEKEYWTYDQYGRELTQTDFDGNVSSYSYYTTYGSGAYAGEISQVVYTAAAGSGKQNQTVSYQYNNLGNQTSVTDASGTTTNVYDAFGNLIESDTPEGDIHYVFNSATGEHTETWTGTSHSAATTDTLYGYNALGELTMVTVIGLDGASVNLVTSYTYDANGNKLSETLPDGEVTTYTYDSLNRLISETEVQGSSTLFTEVYTLNSDGTRASSSETELQPDGSMLSIGTTWTYDADGRLLTETQTSTSTPAADESNMTPPPDGLATWLVLPSSFPSMGGSYSSGTTPLIWDGQAYVSPGMTDAEIGVDSGAALLPPSLGAAYGGDGSTEWVLVLCDGSSDYTWSFTLDGGNEELDTDGVISNDGNSYSIDIGPADQGYTDTYTYDLASNRMSKTHVGPGGGPDDIINYTYNGDNELTSQISALTGETDSIYDANGSLVTQISSTPSYSVNLNGSFGTGGMAVISAMSGNEWGISGQAILSNSDILLAGTGSDPSNGQDDIVLTELNPDGTIDTSFGSDGLVYTRTTNSPGTYYEGLNGGALLMLGNGDFLVAVTEYTDYRNSNLHDIVLAEYNPNGTLNTSFGTGGIVHLNSYACGVTNLSIGSDGTTQVWGSARVGTASENFEAELNANGTLHTSFGSNGILLNGPGYSGLSATSTVLANGDTLVASQIQDNDHNDIGLMEYEPDGSLDNTFGSDGQTMFAVTDEDVDSYVTALSILPDGTIVVSGTLGGNFAFQGFVAEYSLSSIASGTSPDGSSQETDYTYDVRNKLVKITDNGVTQASYVYDDVGDRVQETVGNVTTYFLTDTQNPTGYDQPVEEKTSLNATPTLTFILGDRVLGQADSQGDVSYLLADGHGSTRLLTTSTGTITAAFNYDAFGTALNFNASMAATPYLYGGGGIFDAPTGMYMYGNGTRDREAGAATYFQRDNIDITPGDIANANLSLFVDSDPVNFDDPTGHFTTLQGIVIHGAIESMYEAEHPFNRLADFNTAIPGSGGLLYPDIMDYTLGEVGEIKPLTPYGLSTGLPQLRNYLNGLNGNGATSRGGTILSLPATPNDAGKRWTPSTWQVGVQPVPVPLPDQWVFTVGNVGGVIYYTSLPKPQYSLQSATDVVKNLAQQLNAYSMILSNPNDPAAVPIMQQIETGLSLAINRYTVTGLAIGIAGYAMSDMLATVGLAALDTIMAFA